MIDVAGDPPPSHGIAAETAVKRALNAFNLPEGHGERLTLSVEGAGDVSDMVRRSSVSELSSRGWLIASGETVPRSITVRADTLYVMLSGSGDKRIKRRAESRLSATLVEDDGSRKEYAGTGIYEDTADRSSYDRESDLTYVFDHTVGNRFITALKPMIIGAAMTVFAWALYSYRG